MGPFMTPLDDKVIVVKDGTVIRGSASRVYQYVWDARSWPRLNPHVKEVNVLEERPNYQHLWMQIESDGKIVTMVTERFGEPHRAVTYFQTQPPPFFKSHKGQWGIEESEGQTSLTLVHTVAVCTEKARMMLGLESDEDISSKVSSLLRRNGNRTIEAIKNAVEAQP